MMSDCEFSHLPIGSSCALKMVNPFCFHCGEALPDGSYWAIYRGHFTDGKTYHNFELPLPFYCGHCGERIAMFMPECTGGGSFTEAEVLDAAAEIE